MTKDEASLVVDVISAGRVAFVRLEGELDAGSADGLVTTLQDLLDRGSHDVVLDCGRLRFCDSSGLRALLIVRQAQGDGATCTLVRPRPLLRRLLTVTGLTDTFEVTGGPEARDAEDPPV